MNTNKPINAILLLLTGAALTTLGLLAGQAMSAYSKSDENPVAVTASSVLHYQGRLLDPDTGKIKDDGEYTMLFELYTQEEEGSPIWTETQTATVSKGIFSILLGEVTSLNPTDFNGQDLWLGVTVESDPQMTPRQPLAYVPYAFYANNAGNSNLANNANNADTLGGYSASSFAPASHGHIGLPKAYGYYASSGIQPGSYNVASAAWDNSWDAYRITFNGFNLNPNMVRLVSLEGNAVACQADATIRTSVQGDDLLVYVLNSSGTSIACDFHFIIFGEETR